MRIVALVENRRINKEYKQQHGLSLFIETKKHKILFDAGSNIVFYNAKKHNIDLRDVDLIIISHGHIDHTEALIKLLEMNKKAKVYIHENAFDKHYVRILGLMFGVGVPKNLIKYKDRIEIIEKTFKIDDELSLIDSFKERQCWSYANNSLFMKKDGKYILDDFSHEQCLLISSENKNVLIGGCCHNGIINVLTKVDSMNLKIDYVISGFHFLGLNLKKERNKKLILDISNRLEKRNEKYYTCHCTGVKAYKMMKNVLNEKLDYLHSGEEINL